MASLAQVSRAAPRVRLAGAGMRALGSRTSPLRAGRAFSALAARPLIASSPLSVAQPVAPPLFRQRPSQNQPSRTFFKGLASKFGFNSQDGCKDEEALRLADRMFEQAQALKPQSRADLLKISALLQAALEANPRHQKASLLLGHIYHLMSMYEQSIDVLTTASNFHPHDTKILYHLASVKSDRAMKAMNNVSAPDRRGQLRAHIQAKELEAMLDAVTEFQQTVLMADVSNDPETLLSALPKFSLWAQTVMEGNALASLVLLRSLQQLEHLGAKLRAGEVPQRTAPEAVDAALQRFIGLTNAEELEKRDSAARLLSHRMVEHWVRYLEVSLPQRVVRLDPKPLPSFRAGPAPESPASVAPETPVVSAASAADLPELSAGDARDKLLLDEARELLKRVQADPVSPNTVTLGTLQEMRRALRAGPFLAGAPLEALEPESRRLLLSAEAGVYQSVGALAAHIVSLPKFNVLQVQSAAPEPVKGFPRTVVELAELAFALALRADPAAGVHRELISAKLVLGKKEEAIAAARGLPDSAGSAEDRAATLVWTLVSAGQPEAAEAEALAALERFPEATLLHLSLARLSLLPAFAADPARSSERALRHAQQAMRLQPSLVTQNFVQKVEAALRARREGRAEDEESIWQEQSMAREVAIVRKMVMRAVRLQQGGQVESAQQCLEEAIRRYPNISSPYMHLANLRIHRADSNFQAAMKAIDTAQDPEAADTARRIRAEERGRALEDLKTYAEKNPADAAGHQLLASLAFQLQQYDLCLEHCRLATSAPNATKSEFFQAADLEANIALARRNSGALREAVLALKRVLQMDMDFLLAHVRLSVYQSCLGNLNEADHHLARGKALARDEDDRALVSEAEQRCAELKAAHQSRVQGL